MEFALIILSSSVLDKLSKEEQAKFQMNELNEQLMKLNMEQA